ncbi:hypothetical protein BpHYR1_013452, partial [Brachionus plicatilis]
LISKEPYRFSIEIVPPFLSYKINKKCDTNASTLFLVDIYKAKKNILEKKVMLDLKRFLNFLFQFGQNLLNDTICVAFLLIS